MNEIITALGLMSGTSMDGIDVAVLRTDGETVAEPLYARTFPYTPETLELVRACIGLRDEQDPRIAKAERAVTSDHEAACREALSLFPEISLIGFHGQTIWHAPGEGLTRQLGDGQLLANLTSRNVVYDFRSNDMRHGGQGAPLLPLYHAAKSSAVARPAVIVNIGGVSNVTYIDDDTIIAFDTGPGNAMLNDWMERHTGTPMDKDGNAASRGTIDHAWIEAHLQHPYFTATPPKSLDRQDFTIDKLAGDWSCDDGAATLSMFTAQCIAKAQHFLPHTALNWIVAGGGSHNPVIMTHLRALLSPASVITAKDAGWNADSLEAEGFAYLAVRAKKGKPLSLPTTTGCRAPVSGGVLVKPNPMAEAV